MKKLLVLLLLLSINSFADDITKGDIEGKVFINSSAKSLNDSKTRFSFAKDGSLSGFSNIYSRVKWEGAWTFSQGGVTLLSDQYKCRYAIKKVGDFFSFSRTSGSSDCTGYLLMKVDHNIINSGLIN